MSEIEEQTRLMVYTPSRETWHLIESGLRDLSGVEATHIRAGMRKAIEEPLPLRGVHIVMVDASDEPDPLLAVRELIDVCPPTAAIIVMGRQNDIRLYRKMHDAGASEYLFLPLKAHLVTKCVREWIPQTRTTNLIRKGRAVMVTGVRGGCGASTIAMRLARNLSINPARRVLLVDFDFRAGDLPLQCDLPSNENTYLALRGRPDMDEMMLARATSSITRDLDLLATLAPVDARGHVTQVAVSSTFERATARYRYAVGEIPITQLVRAMPQHPLCQSLILVSDARLSSARDIGRWREWLAAQPNVPTVVHILNKAGSRSGLTVEEFTRVAGTPPDLVIPYSTQIASGSLFGLRNDRAYAEMDNRLGNLAMRVAQAAHKKPATPGVIARLSSLFASGSR